jgi:undecaprenyl-diphosphatase
LAFIDTLKSFDRKFFLFLNSHHNLKMDYLMYWMSNMYIWIPFYLVLIGLVIYYFRKQSWLIVLSLLLLITASDQTSGLIKRSVGRYRPCHNTELIPFVHNVGNCGGQYGFVSSHAANTFALATFMSLLLIRKYEYSALIFFGWAAVVSYSRIYVGVHYPADVAGGALLGISIALGIYKLYRLLLRKIYPDLVGESLQ